MCCCTVFRNGAASTKIVSKHTRLTSFESRIPLMGTVAYFHMNSKELSTESSDQNSTTKLTIEVQSYTIPAPPCLIRIIIIIFHA
jgi:hypothetical protein